MSWVLRAEDSEKLAKALLEPPAITCDTPDKTLKVANEEVLPVIGLLNIARRAGLIRFPLVIRHTGGATEPPPDFQLEMDGDTVAVEVTKLTDPNIEHGRKRHADMAQKESARFKESSIYFQPEDFCDPDGLARMLKTLPGRATWPQFIVARLSPGCGGWLRKWQGGEFDYKWFQKELAHAFNDIVNGPNIVGSPELAEAWPTPEITRIEMEGFPAEMETPKDRMEWLRDAFREYVIQHRSQIFRMNALLGEDKPIDKHEIIQRSILLNQCDIGPTIEEEHRIFLQLAQKAISQKISGFRGPAFRRGHSNWLLLWDNLRSPEWVLSQRARAIAEYMVPIWGPDSFSDIILLDMDFRWMWRFSANSNERFDSDE